MPQTLDREKQQKTKTTHEQQHRNNKQHESHNKEQSGNKQSHHKQMMRDFKIRFFISLAITVPVLVLSPMIQSFIGVEFTFAGRMLTLFALSSIVYFYGGWPFLKGVYTELKKKQPGMMTLIGLAISVAYVYSGMVVFGLRGKIFFWELVTLVDIMLLGHWIEMKSVMGASMAVEKLVQLMPSKAHKKEGDSITDVSIDELQKGDQVLVKPGEKIPVDGKVVDGSSEVNEAMITGESKPVAKKKDDSVIGGAVNETGSLTVQVEKTGKDSYLSQVVELVRSASESKSRAQSIADKAAFWLTVVALSAGLITLLSWLVFGKEFVFALERMVTVMVITCPHALGLAIPLVIAVITALSAQNGLLVRNRTAFESSFRVNTVVFDKTGTLTLGQFGVTDIVSLGDMSEKELLAKAASVESNSEHTIAQGIVNKAKDDEIKFESAQDFKAIPGKGAKAKVGNTQVFLGNEGILDESGASSDSARKKMDSLTKNGKTVVFVVIDKNVEGIIGLADQIREESKEAVDSLKKTGIEVAMITGDNEQTARYVADKLGIDTYYAGVLPDKKADKIREIKQKKNRIAMVGDGINDAPALAEANVGIAIGTGTDVAVETADVVLVDDDPRNVADVFNLSRITRRKMIQNLIWATGYNVVAIPLAAGVLYGMGIMLSPAVGALIMSLSTIIVAINAKLVSYSPQTERA